MRVQRHAVGSVRYDKRRGTWSYLWYDGPTRRSKRIGTKTQFPTKASAWKEVDRLEIQKPKQAIGNTVASVVATNLNGCPRDIRQRGYTGHF
jgi:hypothetical protein